MIERKAVAAPSGAPRHVAIIMDGNRRWAREQGLPTLEGHRRGAASLRSAVATGLKLGIEILTVFAFSEENWRRDSAEIGGIFRVAATFAEREAAGLARQNVRVRIVGRCDRLPQATADALGRLEDATAHADGMLLNLAVDYSARAELVNAVRSLAAAVASGTLAPDAIDDEQIAGALQTAGLPDPDLLIRTGGELRLSNFLLYQCAYTELWSTPHAWPAFTPAVFREAIADFTRRQRRFGR